MAEAPSQQLQEKWLTAVLLPGQCDPKISCLEELAGYTGLDQQSVLQRCEGAVDDQRQQWYLDDRSSDQSMIDFYNECDAYIFELLWWHALQQGLAPAWNARLLDIAESFHCKDFLDFGAGVGSNSILMARSGITVTNADISDVMQKFAKYRLDQRKIVATFIDLKSESLPANSYDMISAIDVLEHVSNPLETISSLHTALKPGGILVFDVIASRPDSDRPFHLMRSKYPIRSRIRSMGFRLIEEFQKYAVYQKVERNTLAKSSVMLWDRCRWRAYYAVQGKWPAVGR